MFHIMQNIDYGTIQNPKIASNRYWTHRMFKPISPTLYWFKKKFNLLSNIVARLDKAHLICIKKQFVSTTVYKPLRWVAKIDIYHIHDHQIKNTQILQTIDHWK